MARLSKQAIRRWCLSDTPMIYPFMPSKVVISGKSAGLSSASYDARIDHDLVLGINPALIIGEHVICYGFSEERLLQDKLIANPPMKALAYTVEDFHIPNGITGDVGDKSSYARVFVSAFNTFFDPGFHGNATLELINHGDEPVTYKRGDPVCQFIFSYLDEPTEEPYNGKYQHQTKAAHSARQEVPTSEMNEWLGRTTD